jgi:hypothetical protein
MKDIGNPRESLDEACERLTSRLRHLGAVTPGPDFTDRVMERIETAPKPIVIRTRIRNALLWLVRPRTLRVSPLGGLAFAFGLVLVLGMVFRIGQVEEIVAPQDLAPVNFVLEAPGAHEVAVIGSFNGWNAAGWGMRRDAATGRWFLSTALPPGSHEYVFLVDGVTPLPDAAAALSVNDGFGSQNSVLVVKSNDAQPL